MKRPALPSASAVFALLVLGCGARSDHEMVGDRRYAEGAFVDALAEYRFAARSGRAAPELQAKIAQAALRAGRLEEAAAAYRSLAGDGSRTAPAGAAAAAAADGLLRVAREAATARDVVALRAAVGALRAVAPVRLIELGGSLALAVDPERRIEEEDLILAAASQLPKSAADTLLAGWAELVLRAGRCDDAERGFEAVSRRGAAALARGGRAGLAGCRVEEGRAALSQGRLEEAELAFRTAISLGGPDSVIRQAWLLTGDARWAGGDTLGAVEAYQKTIQGGDPGNPIVARAEEQLRRLLGGTPPQP